MFENEYQPMIENDCFYLLFKDYKGSLHKVEVTKEVFLQFFGVHKMINNQNQKKYLIVYRDAFNVVEKELTEKEYKEFQSFKSMQIKESNIYERYIEHYELDDYSLHKRLKEKNQKDIVGDLFHEMLINKLLDVYKRQDGFCARNC